MSTLNERLIGGNLDGTSTPLPLPSRYQVVFSSKYPAGNRRETGTLGYSYLAAVISSKYPTGNRREMVRDPTPTP
jgi:hypothetical protein